MALESPTGCSIFLANHPEQSPIQDFIFHVRAESGRTDWNASGSNLMREDRLLPWESTDLSGARVAWPWLSIWIERDYDMVSVTLATPNWFKLSSLSDSKLSSISALLRTDFCFFSSLAADRVIFNSRFNQTSFLDGVNRFLNIQSICKIKNLPELIQPKCDILYFPLALDGMHQRSHDQAERDVLHLIWPHRWEHDKNPRLLADTLLDLHDRGVPFKVSIIGEQYQEYPDCFDEMRNRLSDRIVHFGYLSRSDYLECLKDGDVVLSTADHEFYGVSM